MLLEQAQSGADHLGFIIKSPTGNEPIDQPFEMRCYDFAHAISMFQQFQSVGNVDAQKSHEFLAWSDQIEEFAWHLLKHHRLDGATFPEDLRRIGVQPVAAYDQQGNVRPFEPKCTKRDLKDCLEVQPPDGGPIIFRGLIVRPDFTEAVFDAEIVRRRQIVRYFHEQGQLYYASFRGMVERRALRQKQAYGNLTGKMQPEVDPGDFDFLRPPPPAPRVNVEMPSLGEIDAPLYGR